MNDILFKLISILISFLFLYQAFYIKKKVGTFLIPSSLFSLAWFFFSIIPLVILFPIPINPLGLTYILTCCTAFSLGALHFNWKIAFSLNLTKTKEDSLIFETMYLKSFFFISIVCSLVASILIIKSSGIELFYLLSNPLLASGQFAKLRVEGKLEYGLLGVLNFFFTYLSPILGALVYSLHKNQKIRYISFAAAFLPVIFFMLVQSAKIVIFYSLGFYFSGYLIRKIYNNSLDLFSKKNITALLIIPLIIIPLIILSISSRHNISDNLQLAITASKAILGYAFGQIYAFSDYFAFLIGFESNSQYVNDFNSFGRYTFTSLYNLIDSSKTFPPGTFIDYYNYKNFIMTNIYTFFRGSINDFGVIGTIVFMYISGVIIHFCFYTLLSKRHSYASISAMIVFMVFLEGTYLISVFMARFMYLIFFAVLVILKTNDYFFNKSLSKLQS